MTRRVFIGWTAGACVAGGLVGWPIGMRRTCVCDAEIIAASNKGWDDEAEGFCPNCGRTVARQMFKLRSRGWEPPHRHRRGAIAPRWDPAQVPFPNATLVKRTDKATLTGVRVRV
jgi:hypothetical protein